jgi:hypothetical protein
MTATSDKGARPTPTPRETTAEALLRRVREELARLGLTDAHAHSAWVRKDRGRETYSGEVGWWGIGGPRGRDEHLHGKLSADHVTTQEEAVQTMVGKVARDVANALLERAEKFEANQRHYLAVAEGERKKAAATHELRRQVLARAVASTSTTAEGVDPAAAPAPVAPTTPAADASP